MEGVFEMIGLKVGEQKKKGVAVLSTYEFKEKDNFLFNLRAMRDSGGLMAMEDGKYVRLHVNGELMMSDTRMEKNSNLDFVRNAKGKVLIAGLGIGVILKNVLDKLKDKRITEIVIIEKYQDVIDLIAPYFEKYKNIKIVCADIFDWRPEKGTKFDTIYFDIWPNICQDNLEEMAKLHQAFKGYKVKGGWMDYWMKDYLKAQKRRDERHAWGW